MKVYLNNDRVQYGTHNVFVAPGAHVESPPAEWLERDGKAKQIQVSFVNGVAEVPDNLGNYLIKHGQAKKTRLILPRLAA